LGFVKRLTTWKSSFTNNENMTKKSETTAFKRIIRSAMRDQSREAGHKRRVQRDNTKIKSIVRDVFQKIIGAVFKK
jgi:hypothetical protein